MARGVDAQDLVSAARDLTRTDQQASAGLWPRAAALLGRQALELAMTRLWHLTAPGLERTPSRCQLLCVGALLNDRGLGGRVHAAWNALSDSCHHRVYELPPTAAELGPALETVWELTEAVEGLRRRMAGDDSAAGVDSYPASVLDG
jgi:hypothetical protein